MDNSIEIINKINNNEITVLEISMNERLTNETIEQITKSIRNNTSITTIKFKSIYFNLHEKEDEDTRIYNYYNRPEISRNMYTKYCDLKHLYQTYLFSLYDAIIYNKSIVSIDVSSILSQKYTKIFGNKFDGDLKVKFNVYKELMPIIINLINNNHIKRLILTNNRLSDMSDMFEQIKTNTSLEEIDLSNNNIKDVDYIYETLQINKTIKKINLSHNNITSIKGLDKVIESNKVLEEIDLSCNNITDKIQSDYFFVNSSNKNIISPYKNFDTILYSNVNDILNKLNKLVKKNNNIKKINLSFNNIYCISFIKYDDKIIFSGNPGLIS